MLQGLDRYGLPLPPILEGRNVDTWRKISDYFVRAAHHGDVDEGEFLQRQYECELFLIERLQPPTFDHHAELDELIARGERRGS